MSAVLQLLQVFVKVYECRNFTKASELLFISQPTISLKMKQLEEQLNVTLFIRKGAKSIQPTPQADFLYEQAMTMLDLWKQTVYSIEHESLEVMSCTIACSNTFGMYYLPAMMPQFIERFPNVEFTLTIMNSEEAVQQLQQHEADIAFVEKPIDTTGLYKKVLFQDELVLVGQEQSPQWLMREKHSGIRYFNELFIAENNLQPQFMYVNNSEMMRQLLMRGVGRTIMPKLAIGTLPYEELPDKYNRNMYFIMRHVDSTHPLYGIERWIEAFFAEHF